VTILAKARQRGHMELLVGVEEAPGKGSKGYDDFILRNVMAYAEL
jgi:hypothetical protein